MAISLLMALLGLGFGLVQFLGRSDISSIALSGDAPEQPPALVAVNSANLVAPPGGTAAPGPGGTPDASTAPAARTVQAEQRVIEPTYTVEAGDTLARIAARYNTTVERLQALNNLADPRTLRIGQKLVIPPPLP